MLSVEGIAGHDHVGGRLFDENGRMTHLITGTSGVDTCPLNRRGPCLDCKYDYWTYTLVSPLRTS